MPDTTKAELIDEAIALLEKVKHDYPIMELHLDVRRFRNKVMKSELMPQWEVDEVVSKLHDFLMDFAKY